jgi:hypothetical protein
MRYRSGSIQTPIKNRMKSQMQIPLKIAGLAASAALFGLATLELYQNAPKLGPHMDRLSMVWGGAFVSWLIFGGLLLILECLLLFIPQRIESLESAFYRWRARLGWLRWLAAAAMILLPALVLLFTRWGDYFDAPMLRLLILLLSGFGAGVFLSKAENRLAEMHFLVLGLVLSASLFYVAKQLVFVTSFPFALGWSEGNRFYDYSTILGRERYIYPGTVTPARKEMGRYLLWGLPFLLPGSTIWMHRLWNVFLATAPSLALGVLLSRWTRLPEALKWAYALWVFLFLAQGPIYTPLILSALVVVLFVRPKNLALSLIAAGLAGYYASSSRFTWLPAVPAWVTFLYLADTKLSETAFPLPLGKLGAWSVDLLKRLAPTIAVALTALAGGLLANPILFMPKELSQSTTFAQPLLWYRLFPNITYPEGVLGALILACGPLAALLIWMVVSNRWKLNWLQQLAFGAAGLVFLAGGLVASVKIGGGNNLHNMDMFLVTLAIISGLALRGRTNLSIPTWPAPARLALVLILCVPAWFAYSSGTRLSLPAQNRVTAALQVIQDRVLEASSQGEVLFMDQRQLLTFGYVHNITLVSDYEKKYMMDQAMANDQTYFKKFYQDLSNQRFSIIITDPLFTRVKESNYAFAEENNAWVKWVAEPLLCYYTPIRKIPDRVLDDFNIQLLIPRENPQDCP